MNIFKKIVRSLVALSIVLLVAVAFGAGSAYADDCNINKFSTPKVGQNGTFTVTTKADLPLSARVGSAVLSFDPPNASGTIDSIQIKNLDKPVGQQLEFGCGPLKVSDGKVSNVTDLITACGGPAYLAKGTTTYNASGSGFPAGTVATVCLSE
ncbi:MAG: hypothetical protein AB4050_13775 [Synechococcus sp.]